MRLLPNNFGNIPIVILTSVVLLSSCISHNLTNCSQQCIHFNSDSIIICSLNYQSDSAYQAAINTARLHYTENRDSSYNNTGFSYDAAKIAQLESQGYLCSTHKTGGW